MTKTNQSSKVNSKDCDASNPLREHFPPTQSHWNYPQGPPLPRRVIHGPPPPPLPRTFNPYWSQRFYGQENACTAPSFGLSSDHYTADSSCPTFSTVIEATAHLKAKYGGFYNDKQVVKSENTKPLVGGVIAYKYRCIFKDFCQWRCQIRKWPDGKCLIYRSMFNHSHSHPLDAIPTEPRHQYGLNPTINILVEECISNDLSRGTCILSVRASSIIDYVVTKVRRFSELAHVRFQVDQKEHKEKMARQIRRILQHRRERFIESIIGVQSFPNYDALSRVLAFWRLHIPCSYKARNDYQSASEIKVALQLDSEHQMIIFDLSNGEIYDRYQKYAVEPQPSKQEKFICQMEQSFLITSPLGLFQLLQVAKRRSGTRQIGSDGVGGFVNNASTIIIVGCPAVSYCADDCDVMSSLRAIGYLHAGGERLHPYCSCLYLFRHLCFRLFALPFGIDWGVSDHANTFHSSHVFFKANLTLCDDNSTTVDGSQHNVSQKPAAVVTQLSQQTIDSPFIDPSCNFVETISNVNPIDDDAYLDNEASLNCHFHVKQNIHQGTSFASEFKDPTLRDSSKNNTIFRHVDAIHMCKTLEQRQTVTRLVLKHWREELGEVKAADKFEEVYCRYPFANWNYACSGEVGVYPTGNPNESLNKVKKQQVTLNVSLARFLVESAPELLRKDYVDRSDPCIITVPDECSVLSVGLTGFMKDGIDIVELGENETGETEGFLVNCSHRIGIPITQRDILLLNSACDGLEDLFQKKNGSMLLPGEVGVQMSYLTSSFCHVTWNGDGDVVGDCENCFKKLGYKCPGAVMIRDRFKRLRVPLSSKRKVPATSVIRNTTKQYKSGPASRGRKKMSIPPMRDDFPSYLKSLSHVQVSHLVSELRLFRNSSSEANPNGLDAVKTRPKKELLRLLLLFGKDPSGYRLSLKKPLKKTSMETA